MIMDRTATGKPSTSSRRSRFLGCFGFSGEKMEFLDEVNSSSRRRSRRWSFGCKKSSIEIVDVDSNTVYRKSKSVNEAQTKPDTSLTKTHVIMVDANHAPVTSDEQKTISPKKWTDIVKRESESFRTRRKETEPADISATGTGVDSDEQKVTSRKKRTDIVKRKNRSFRTDRKETKSADTSVTDASVVNVYFRNFPSVELLEKKTVTIGHPSVSSPSKQLTYSKSLPVPKKQKPLKAPIAGGGGDDGVMHKPPPSGGDFDSIIAMSTLLTILVIMVLWGKICAIFCTCAWFLVAPRLLAAGEQSTVAVTERRLPELQDDLNLESVEYKKKVVLEGLLQRNHRNVVGRLM